jgi:hypothetical protein
MSFGGEGDWKLLKGHAPKYQKCHSLLLVTQPTVDQNITHTAKTESVAKSICNEQVIDLRFTLSLPVTNILLSS